MAKKTTLQLVNDLRRDLQGQLELATLVAEIRWHSYNAHCKAGFTPEQALRLCAKPYNGSSE